MRVTEPVLDLIKRKNEKNPKVVPIINFLASIFRFTVIRRRITKLLTCAGRIRGPQPLVFGFFDINLHLKDC